MKNLSNLTKNVLITINVHILILEHVDSEEAKNLFETNYSNCYYILYDTFVQAENNLKQRGKRSALLTQFPFQNP